MRARSPVRPSVCLCVCVCNWVHIPVYTPLSIFAILQTIMLIPCVSVGAAGSTVTQKKGENVTLNCPQVQEDESLATTIWYKDDIMKVSMGQSGGTQYTEPSLESKFAVEQDSSLVLMRLDPGDSGNYTCKVFVVNSTGVMDNNSTTWIVLVQDVPSPPGQARIVDTQSRQVKVEWSPSDSDNNSPISNYVVLISECQTGNNKREIVVGESTHQVTITNLEPYTCYQVHVRATNDVGRSLPGPPTSQFYTESESNDTVTTPGPPQGAPTGFQAVPSSKSSIKLSWVPPMPEVLNGELKGYKVTYTHKGYDPETIHVEDPTKTETVLQGLVAYTWYTVSILAYNDQGDGPKAEVAVQTLEGVPTSPRITHITGREATSFYVHWEPPKTLNGHLTAYELQWILDNNETKTRIISGHLTNPMSAFITNLRPYTEYKIQVAAFTGGGRGEFSEKYPALTDVAAPSTPFIRNVTVLSDSSVFLQWDPPGFFSRRIDKYVLKWWDTRGNDPDTMVSGTQNQHTLQGLTTNMRYSLKIAGVTRAIFSKRFLVGEFTAPVTFTLGVESLDESNIIWDNLGKDNNDPTVKEDNQRVPTEIIAGVTCAIIVVLIVVVIFIGYKSLACQKCYQAAYYYLAVPSNMQSTPPTVVTVAEPSVFYVAAEEKEYPEISVSDFPAHVESMHVDSDFAFSQEFEDLYRNSRTDFKCEASNMPDNRNKNRYINIAAFDHSRVPLKMDLGRLRQSDYINANYVDGYEKPKAYIATQGPLPQTFSDFWRMVWEQNVSVIVMITNLMEKGRRKCDQYWPSDGLEIYGNMSVKFLSTVRLAHYTVNIFSLRNMKRHSMKGVSERTVYQYHYTEWPDHGVPDYTLPVLEFVQKSAACNPPDGGPIIVHCSAGVGRTGTYILIDSMIRQIGDKGTINIPGFTLHIRRQRNLLVQTEDQYMFIHDVLVEYLMGGGQTEVSDENIVSYVASLTASSNGAVPHDAKTPDTCTSLEKQHKLITAFKPKDDEISCAMNPANSEKNRSTDYVPMNLKRVILPARPGIEGSEYINATYLQGYKKSDQFIVTQHPVDLTKEDFWRMVWDRNSPVIIVLKSSEDEEDFLQFWPEKGSSVEVDAGNFKLSMRDDPEEETGYTTMDFILESIQYDYIFMTKLVIVTDWPEATPPTYSVFNLIDSAIDWQRTNDIGPVIVMDKFGGVKAGRLCALWTLRDQLIMDKAVDVYQLCKLYHLKRPGVVGEQDDLRYLYEAVACLREHLQEEESVSSSSPRHHHGHGSSIRKNGTLPRSSTLQSNNTNKNETNI
ncbi:tyrosine-protein phosphatase 99A-like isoform X2 [Littorina saxatilis]|uniref:tyrosine-protein phosphatase 99A-like isoform X2 n=1 Tax=Littorina saxatilis TaxID=31220 RepID=UPI0038B61CFE